MKETVRLKMNDDMLKEVISTVKESWNDSVTELKEIVIQMLVDCGQVLLDSLNNVVASVTQKIASQLNN